MSQQKSTKKLLAELDEQLDSLEQRREVATNIANNLEERNKQKILAIDKEVQVYKNTKLSDLNQEIELVESEIQKTKIIKNNLLDDISKLSSKKTKLESELDELIILRDNTSRQLSEIEQTSQELNTEILKLNSTIKTNEEKINNQLTMIRELESQKQQLEGDLEILRVEQDNIEDEIIELDTNFKSQKRVFDDQLYETNLKLDKALSSLIEAQKKDEAFRVEWAEKTLQLEKRTDTVRRMEAKVSGAEARIQELKRFDVL